MESNKLSRREPRGCLGFLTESHDDPQEGKQWGVEFWSTTNPLTVIISEQVLREAGVVLEKDSVVEADINMDATTPEEVNPRNLHWAGRLPSLEGLTLSHLYGDRQE